MSNKLLFPLVLAGGLLVGCVAQQPYYDNYDRGYAGSDRGYYDRGQSRSSSRYCDTCGEVLRVERIHLRDQSSGLGAVIGALVGGALGNTVGGGDGRRAATVAGAVAGGFAGHAVEGTNRGAGQAWRIDIRLEDGRRATVTQLENPGFRRGDRVVIRGNRLYYDR